MQMKLGDMLIQEGKITSAQLEEALKLQVIFGGRLGTNLIEMGLLQEDEIARLLSKKLKVPYLDPPDHLMKIPADVIQLIPSDIAEKYQVIPFRKENRRLTLVMADPSNLKAIDEIAFRTGFIIQPAVTPELRLSMALEKHYNVGRYRRSIKTESGFAKEASRFHNFPASTTPQNVQALPVGQVWLREDPPEGIPDQETVEAWDPHESDTVPANESFDMDYVCNGMAEAGDRDEVARLLIGFLGQEFRRSALLLVKDQSAIGWKAMADKITVTEFHQFSVPFDEASVFKTVVDSKGFYLGPLPRTPYNSLFLQEMGGDLPDMAVLVPIMLAGRVVGVIYADGGNEPISNKVLDLQMLATKTAMAFEILVLKNKIRKL